jgi:hypothetical protein
VLVVQPPCRLKSCDDCWSRERRRLEGVLTRTFAQCRICSTLPHSIGTNATSFGAFKRWTQRHGRLWFASIDEAGQVTVILEGTHPEGVEVSDVGQVIAVALQTHDRTRRLRSSHKIKLSDKRLNQSLWQLLITSPVNPEKICEVATCRGLEVVWEGVDLLRVLGTEQEINDLVRELA